MTDEWEEVTTKSPVPTLTITSSHIARAGDKRDVFKDPVSIALKEATGADWCMSGWGYATCGFPNNIRRSYTLYPHKILQDFFRRWQYGKPVEPISVNFILDREVDKTPKVSKRKPVQNKSWLQIQSRLELK